MAHQALTECTKVHAATAHSNMLAERSSSSGVPRSVSPACRTSNSGSSKQMMFPVGIPVHSAVGRRSLLRRLSYGGDGAGSLCTRMTTRRTSRSPTVRP